MFAVLLIIVALLWGATNPLIKRGSKDIRKINERSKIKQFLMEIKYLVTNLNYIIPFLLNQSGSVLYVYALQKAELSLAVPVANSLTFVFTAISGKLLGEASAGKRTYLGMILILFGTTLCILDKYYPIYFDSSKMLPALKSCCTFEL